MWAPACSASSCHRYTSAIYLWQAARFSLFPGRAEGGSLPAWPALTRVPDDVLTGNGPTYVSQGIRTAVMDREPGLLFARSDRSRRAAGLNGHSGLRIIRISSLVSSGVSRSLPGQRPVTSQPSRA